MQFASDNAGPVHPTVMDALVHANTGHSPAYGADALMDRVRTQIRDVFEAPEAAVYLVATGTAANALILATLAQPWETIYCAQEAHIQEDECNAPEFYTGGAKLTLVGDQDKINAAELETAILSTEKRGVHGPQRGPVSVTQVSDNGTVYSLGELHAICDTAKTYGLPVHMDGARFANALVALGCSPAEMSWRAGVDALSFGGTKNGLMGVEAVIFFDPRHAREFELRRKRGAHLFSKHRYLSAQMAAYLTDDLWLDCARKANAAAQRLADGMRHMDFVSFAHTPDANLVFPRFSRARHNALNSAGATYYLWEGTLTSGTDDEDLTARLVCDWSTTFDSVDLFLKTLVR